MLRGAQALLAAVAVTTVTFAAQAYASPTSPDPGFSAGAVVLGSSTHDEFLGGMTVLGNGKTEVLTSTGTTPSLALYRLAANGFPDSTFGGGDGKVLLGTESNYSNATLAVDPGSRKTYVSAFLDNGSTSPTTVWRFTSKGAVDTAYGTNGHKVFNKRLVQGLLPLPHGKLLMAGVDYAAHTADVWGLQASGGTDTGFGTAGKALLSSDLNDEVTSLVRQVDGKVVVAGDHSNTTASTLLAYRLEPGGTLDATFSGDGKAVIDPSFPGTTTSTVWTPQVLLRPDGRTVFVAGLNQKNASFFNSLLVAGLAPGGNPDPALGLHTFSGMTETWGQAALERDGKLLVGGNQPPFPSSTNLVLRFTATGALDPTWDGDGKLTLTGGSDTMGVGITPHGRVIVGRTIHRTTYDVALRAMIGTPTPSCHGRLATQFGGSGADRITGSARADVLVGLAGADVLKGLGGNDTICGNAGPDKLIGGSGKDVLIGGAGTDVIKQ
jgi:uncharacterized delta-60 repeat protein